MPIRLLAIALTALLLTGCGVFGCAGQSSNSGYALGCATGVRF